MAKNSPAFQFYAADFLTATAEWTVEEVGAYIRLLSYQWIEGSIPEEIKKISMLISCNEEKASEIWTAIRCKFTRNGTKGRLINLRLETVRQAQREFRDKCSAAGKKSAEARKNKDLDNVPTNVPTKDDGKVEATLQSSSSVKTVEAKASMSGEQKTPDPDGPEKQSPPPPDPPKENTSPPPCPHNQIIALYAEILPELPQVKNVVQNGVKSPAWTGTRMRALATRWKEDEERQNLDWWYGFFQYIRTCPMLMGSNNRNWQPDLGWIVTAGNFEKIRQGNYAAIGK